MTWFPELSKQVSTICNADDYDGRTASALACVHGYAAMIDLLPKVGHAQK